MKTNNKLSAYILRGGTGALLFSCVLVALCSAIHLPEQPPKAIPPQDYAAFGANAHQNRSLSLADRVAYQRAIEDDPFVIAECLARPVLAERFANGDPVAVDIPPTHPARMRPQKPALAGWLAKAETRVPVTMAAVDRTKYTLPVIGSPWSSCIDDTWTATTLTNAPTPRVDHTAVWTGTEMIVWGGGDNNSQSFNTGGRYNPSTDSWTSTSTTNVPAARGSHTAVWTGSEMIIWGGGGT